MRAKKAKALRRLARSSQLPAQDMYLQHRRSGQIILGKCVKGVYRVLKKHWDRRLDDDVLFKILTQRFGMKLGLGQRRAPAQEAAHGS